MLTFNIYKLFSCYLKTFALNHNTTIPQSKNMSFS